MFQMERSEARMVRKYERTPDDLTDREWDLFLAFASSKRRGRPRTTAEAKLKIIQVLDVSPSGRASSTIAKMVGVGRSTASYLLKELLGIGLVERERIGQQVIYSLHASEYERLKSGLIKLFLRLDPESKCLVRRGD
jgi:DNA-binding transcriptional ArsR family regulator